MPGRPDALNEDHAPGNAAAGGVDHFASGVAQHAPVHAGAKVRICFARRRVLPRPGGRHGVARQARIDLANVKAVFKLERAKRG